MNAKSIGFIGGGRITRIFLTALKNNNDQKIVVSDPDDEALNIIKQNYQNVETTNLNELASKQDIVFIAIHPQVVSEVLNEIKCIINSDTIIISLAPKLKMKFISEILNSHRNIIRSIPNSPSIIQKGFNPICIYDDFNTNMKDDVLEIFDQFGEYFETEENNLETYAIITAMGPTYLQFQLNKLLSLSREFGLGEIESRLAVKSMVNGVNSLLFDSKLSIDQIEDLIPVKPLKECEEIILNLYDENLLPLYKRLSS